MLRSPCGPAGFSGEIYPDGEAITLIHPPENASVFTSPVLLPSTLRTAYIANDGDLVLLDEEQILNLPVNALPDTRILFDESERILVLTDPTDRYEDGVLGDWIEAASMTLIETHPVPRVVTTIVMPETEVIEGLSWWSFFSWAVTACSEPQLFEGTAPTGPHPGLFTKAQDQVVPVDSAHHPAAASLRRGRTRGSRSYRTPVQRQRLAQRLERWAVIPAGVAHKCLESSSDFRIVGAYPLGQSWDMCYGKAGERPAADQNIAAVTNPQKDPVQGHRGVLLRLWQIS